MKEKIGRDNQREGGIRRISPTSLALKIKEGATSQRKVAGKSKETDSPSRVPGGIQPADILILAQ